MRATIKLGIFSSFFSVEIYLIWRDNFCTLWNILTSIYYVPTSKETRTSVDAIGKPFITLLTKLSSGNRKELKEFQRFMFYVPYFQHFAAWNAETL